VGTRGAPLAVAIEVHRARVSGVGCLPRPKHLANQERGDVGDRVAGKRGTVGARHRHGFRVVLLSVSHARRISALSRRISAHLGVISGCISRLLQ